MDAILSWLANVILNWLLKTVETQVTTAKEAADAKAQEDKTNAENVAKYEAAKSRAEKIKAATDLLNGVAN